MKNRLHRADINETQYDVQLAANIIKARMDKGWSQDKLAKKVGTLQPAIARAEAGNIPPSHAFLKRIARALDLEIKPPSFSPYDQS